jgi:hypothetical protein
MKRQQNFNIDKAFSEIVKRLEVRKEALKIQYGNFYSKEHVKVEEKLKPLSKNDKMLVSIEAIYKDIKGLLEDKTSIEILCQTSEIMTYIDKSGFELKKIFNS